MFHFAFPVINLKDTTYFHVNTLGAKIGRSASGWTHIRFIVIFGILIIVLVTMFHFFI